MPNLNKVFLMGNLTRDPEIRYTPNGAAICEFGLAINRKWKGTTGDQQEEVTFVDVQAWSKQAELISKYCRKGNPLFVEGRLKLDTWDGKDGQKHSRMKVVLESMQFLGGKSSGSPKPAQRPQDTEEPPPQRSEVTPYQESEDIPF